VTYKVEKSDFYRDLEEVLDWKEWIITKSWGGIDLKFRFLSKK
jgi:hypothetical protein